MEILMRYKEISDIYLDMLEFIHEKHKDGEDNWEYIMKMFEFYGWERFDWFH